MPAGQRRQARIVALQALYEAEYAANSPELIVERTLQEKNLNGTASEFAVTLLKGVIENKQRLDDVIEQFAPAFPVSQMSVMDRNILRLALFEVLIEKSTPVKVAINEAVELGKAFGSHTSSKFINGVLGSVISKFPR